MAKTYITSILLEPSTLDIVAGTDTTLTATILPTTATVKTLNWLSSDENVATVVDGIVTAKAAGSATITAESTDGSNKSATALVTIYDDAVGIVPRNEELAEEAIYTLSGTRIDKITKTGIYIVGGKKRLVTVK